MNEDNWISTFCMNCSKLWFILFSRVLSVFAISFAVRLLFSLNSTQRTKIASLFCSLNFFYDYQSSLLDWTMFTGLFHLYDSSFDFICCPLLDKNVPNGSLVFFFLRNQILYRKFNLCQIKAFFGRKIMKNGSIKHTEEKNEVKFNANSSRIDLTNECTI